MQLQVGQTALVRLKAHEADGGVPKEGHAVAQFWAPGKDPQRVPSQREHPDKEFECFFDGRAWTAYIDTGGWEPGAWTVRGYAACTGRHGPEKGWSWGVMELAA